MSLQRYTHSFVEILNEASREDTDEIHQDLNQTLLQILEAFSPELNMDDLLERMVKVAYKVFDVERIR